MTVLDRVPMDAISDRAAAVHPGKVVLSWLTAAATALAGVLYLLGWVPAKLLRGAWLALVFAGASVAEGWSDAWLKPAPKGADG